MNEKYFAIRTVTRGTVRVGGRVFQVNEQHLKYDGRLDGQRFAFSRYLQGGEYLPFLALWGTEQQWKELSDNDGPQVVEGMLPWVWWRLRKETQNG